MKVTACECSEAGWCERHQCYKSPMWFRLCGRSPQLFALWEQGRGPGQPGSGTSFKAATRPCRHRRDVRRTVACPACRTQVALKVFGCRLHEECTIATQLAGVACCAACPDHEGEDSRAGMARCSPNPNPRLFPDTYPVPPPEPNCHQR